MLVSEGGVLKPQDIYFDLKRVEGTGEFNLLRISKRAPGYGKSYFFPASFKAL